MDSHDSDPIRAALRNQAQCLHAQEEQLKQFQWDLAGMAKHQEGLLAMVCDQLSSLSSWLTHPTVAPNADITAPATLPVAVTSPVSIQLATPEKFSGDSGE